MTFDPKKWCSYAEYMENGTLKKCLMDAGHAGPHFHVSGTQRRPEPELSQSAPVPMLIWCPACGERHVDVGEFATKPHHTHACQLCGHVWRPAIINTVGVRFLPGFKDGG